MDVGDSYLQKNQRLGLIPAGGASSSTDTRAAGNLCTFNGCAEIARDTNCNELTGQQNHTEFQFLVSRIGLKRFTYFESCLYLLCKEKVLSRGIYGVSDALSIARI